MKFIFYLSSCTYFLFFKDFWYLLVITTLECLVHFICRLSRDQTRDICHANTVQRRVLIPRPNVIFDAILRSFIS